MIYNFCCQLFVHIQLKEPIEGLEEWLDAVCRARIPCVVVSSLDRVNMVAALERMGLKNYFQVNFFSLLKLYCYGIST